MICGLLKRIDFLKIKFHYYVKKEQCLSLIYYILTVSWYLKSFSHPYCIVFSVTSILLNYEKFIYSQWYLFNAIENIFKNHVYFSKYIFLNFIFDCFSEDQSFYIKKLTHLWLHFVKDFDINPLIPRVKDILRIP